MNPDLLKNLNLDSSINQNDLQLLTKILGSIGLNDNKKQKITTKERNNLLNKLSSNSTLNDVPQKDLKDMDENEKKIYREELKQKIKNKQNEKKMMRTSKLNKKNFIQNNSNYSDAINKINEMSNNNLNNQMQLTNQQNSIEDTNNNNQKNNDDELKNIQSSNLENTKLEKIIKNCINESEEKINNSANNDNIDDSIDDYLN